MAETKRRDACEEKFLKARKSFKIWPIIVKAEEQPEVCVRRFFILNMKVPADLAREAEITSIKKAQGGHQRSRVNNEYVVTFDSIETRNAMKSYANGLAGNQGAAGLRLELPEFLKGNYRILDKHGLAVKELYGANTKRNIKFDDRNNDLMLDIKLPGSTKWHNVTIEQAKKAKKLREEMEVTKLSQGKTIAGPSADRERSKVLMMVYSPERGPTMATDANLIDIEDSFRNPSYRGEDREDEQTKEEAAEQSSGDESDESMNRLLQGRNAKNPYQ